MKLAIVSGPFYAVPPHDYGGIERRINELSTILAERRHRLYVLASGESSISHQISAWCRMSRGRRVTWCWAASWLR
jgi:hypothetical protein